MNLTNFTQICIYITLVMILFTSSINFVSGTGVFGTLQTGIQQGDSANETFGEYTKGAENPAGLSLGGIWNIGLALAGIATLVVIYLTRSTTIIGVFIYSVVFWVSYLNAISVLNMNNWLWTYPMNQFTMIGTAGMLFIWSASIIGMLTGST